jgi:hypothetical protein
MSKQSGRLNRTTRQSRSRTVSMTPEVADALRMQQVQFKEKFGREPASSDPVFFDPDSDTPQEIDIEKLDEMMIEAMVKAGIDPFYIYAFKKTGLLVTVDNWDKLSPEDQDEWNAAIREFEEIGEQ